jgi:hypothetical protein
MNSDRADSADNIYLALLCQCPAGDPRRAELEALLARHSWHSEDHRVVFEALAGWRAGPEAIRDGLAARVTRRGFPDIELEPYFAPVAESLESALSRLREDLAAAPSGSTLHRAQHQGDATGSDPAPRELGDAPSDRASRTR